MINVGVVREATKMVTSCCASFTVGTVVGNLCPVTNPVAKVAVVIGGASLGGMLGKDAGEYMADCIGDCCEIINGNAVANSK